MPARAEIVLPARGPFDLRATVLSYGCPQVPPYRWTDGPRPRLRRAERLADGRVRLVEIRPTRGGVVLRVVGHDAGAAEVVAPLAARVRRALRLDEDLRPFHAACRRDPALRRIVRHGLGRLLRGTSVFEDVVKTIAVGRAGWVDAVTIVHRLARLGGRCPAHPSLRAFPAPDEIVRAGVPALRDQIGLGDRATRIVALAEDVLAGRRDLEALEAQAASLPSAAIAHRLAPIRGLGAAGTAWLLMLLGHYDRPVIDRAALRWATTALGERAARSQRAVARRLARYGTWRARILWFQQWADTPAGRAW